MRGLAIKMRKQIDGKSQVARKWIFGRKHEYI
jgi:hypothetical protein